MSEYYSKNNYLQDISKNNKSIFQKFQEDEEIYNYNLGDIEKAKKHKSANRPLRKLKENENDLEKCPCCQLAVKKDKVLEPFKICDDPEDFSICGIGVSLFFTSIKFIISIMLIVSIFISSLNIFFSYKYIRELTKFCNDYLKINNSISQNYTEECKYYFTEDDGYFEHYSLADTFFFRFSSVNVKDYRDLYHKINTKKNKSFEDSIINISLVNFICLIFVFLINLLFIFYLFNKTNSIDYLNHTPSDYSIFLYNLDDVQNLFKDEFNDKTGKSKKTIEVDPTFNGKSVDIIQSDFVPNKNIKIIDDFKKYIVEKICKGFSNININNILLCYKLEKLIKLQKELEEKKEKLAKINYDPKQIKKNKELNLLGNNRNYFETFLCCKKTENIKNIEEQKNNLQEEIKRMIKNPSDYILDDFVGSAIITFDSISGKELILKKVSTNFISNCFNFIINIFSRISSYFRLGNYEEGKNIYYYERNIKYEAAPEPEDIIFENLEILEFERVLRTLLFFFISLIICFLSLCIVAALNRLQEILDKNEEHPFYLYIISFLITIVLEFIDFILEIILEILTKYERQFTYTNFYLSYSIKLTISSSLNSVLVPFLCEIIFTKSKRYEILIGNLFIQFLYNSFITPVLMTYNICWLFKKIKQKCIIKRKKEKSEDFTTQKELNELFELSDMDISTKYSYIAKTVFMSFFYIPIFPLGTIISFLGFLCFYWLEKINFAKMYKKPKMINSQIAEFYNTFFIIALFIYAIGDYIFLSHVYEKRTWSIINISVFSFLIIFPYQQFLAIDYLKCKESPLYKKSYDKACLHFNVDYEIANPMTFREGTKKLNEKKKSKGMIDITINNIEYLDNLDYSEILSLYTKNKLNYGYYTGNK